MRAADLVLQRIWPARKSRPIALTLPTIQSAADVVEAVGNGTFGKAFEVLSEFFATRR